MPKVIVPPPYRGPTGGRGEIQVEGHTVLECLEAVEKDHAGFLAQIVATDGTVHRFVKLFRNGDQITGDALGEKLAPDDELEVLAAIAGG